VLRIQSLINSKATRSAIIDAFKTHLLNNSEIPDKETAKNTTMIFFFAGHGSRAKAPHIPLTDDGMVETICPYDERTFVGDKYVHGIPDYVLGVLLRRLAQKKGDNIVRGVIPYPSSFLTISADRHR
jgi:hypothetical protein